MKSTGEIIQEDLELVIRLIKLNWRKLKKSSEGTNLVVVVFLLLAMTGAITYGLYVVLG